MPKKMCPLGYGDGKFWPCTGAKCEIFVETAEGSGEGHCALRGLASLPDLVGSLKKTSVSLTPRK